MLGELFAVGQNHVGEVSIFGAPPKILLDDGDHIFYTLRLVEPLILSYTGFVLLSEG